MAEGLKMKTFKVRVLVVPSNLEVQLGIASVHYEVRVISGYTLKDAKRRAGIQ